MNQEKMDQERAKEQNDFRYENGQIVEVKIDDMSREGQGIGRASGLVVFVPGAVAGDVVRAALTKVKKSYALARLVEILEPSPWRSKADVAVLGGETGEEIPEGGETPMEGGKLPPEGYGKSSIESICASFSAGCGGCPYGGLIYEAQLLIKERQVRQTLQRIAGLDNPAVRPMIGMTDADNDGCGPYRYRNKAQFPISTGGIITRKGGIVENLGDPAVGFYRAKSHEVVNCEDCYLQSMAAVAAADALRTFMEEDHITAWDPKWDKGLMRHLIVKTAFATKEVMVILVINGKGIPNGQKLVAMLDDAIYEAGYSLESVVLSIKKGNRTGTGRTGGKKAKTRHGRGQLPPSDAFSGDIMGDENIVLAGKPVIHDMVGDLSVEISPASFYQVNPVQMQRLYEKVREYCGFADDEGDRKNGEMQGSGAAVGSGRCEAGVGAGNDGAEADVAAGNGGCEDEVEGEMQGSGVIVGSGGFETDTDAGNNGAEADKDKKPVILDLYCGVGSIGLFCADKAEMVVGIESVKEAVVDANRNAVINGIVNARYLCGKAEAVLPLYAGYRQGQGSGDGLDGSGRDDRNVPRNVPGEENGIGVVCGEEVPADENGTAAGCGEEVPRDVPAGDRGQNIDAELASLVQRADIAILDPPRAGCRPELLEAVALTGVDRIVYVSCDPATLARDIKLLRGLGYEFVEATPVDMFPGTSGIEVVCLLSRKNR